MVTPVSPLNLACAASLFSGVLGCRSGFDLPPVVTTSKYLVYRTDVDASVVCMDDLLAREDAFVERTAELLGVDPPADEIDLVWDPERGAEDPWICPEGDAGCYRNREEDGLSIVVSLNLSNHHELVHAVEIQALGQDGHKTLVEGLAEYLGTAKSSAPRSDFSAAFKAMLAADPTPSDYRLAMHFVGSIFAKHGSEKYRSFRAKLPGDAGVAEFAEVFAAEYGQSLDAALAEMSGTRVYSIDQFPGCAAGEAEEMPWTSAGLIDTVLENTCGDPWFFGGGFVDGAAGFYAYHIVEVPEAGEYELRVVAAGDAPAPLAGLLTGCSFDILESGVASLNGQSGRRPLKRGRHALALAYPAQSSARGAASVRLEYLGPSAP